ncbi:MAG: hypothetical protein OCD76_10300 [Reichenbachiella sp.]
MKVIKLLILTIAVSINTAFAQKNSANDPGFPPLENRYLGQKPPGLIPELFAPGIVSTEEYVAFGGDFTPDMRAFYFTRYGGKYKNPTLFVMQYENHRWGSESFLSTDIDNYRERFNPGWSEMKSLEPYKDLPIHGLSVSAKGTYYIDEFTAEGDGVLRCSRLINGEREAPKPLDIVINTGKWPAHPFIAPDESYLMWDVEIEGNYGADIYISFRQQDGSWGMPINMGDEINTGLYDQSPRVTPDEKYLFFWKGDERVKEDGSTYLVGSPYWVDAQVIENLRPK